MAQQQLQDRGKHNYQDDLERLENSGFGCYVGNTFLGALAYANDLVLLSPSLHGLNGSSNDEIEVPKQSLWIKSNNESIQIIRQPDQCDASWAYDVEKLTRDAFFSTEEREDNVVVEDKQQHSVVVEVVDKTRDAIVYFFRGVHDSTISTITTIGDQITNLSETFRDKVVHTFENVGNVVQDTASGIGGALVDTSRRVGDVVVETSKGVGDVVVRTSRGVGDLIVNGAGQIKDVTVDTAKKVGEVIVDTAKCGGKNVQLFMSSVANTRDSIKEILSGFLNWYIYSSSA